MEANGKPVAITYVNGHIVIPAGFADGRRQHHPHRVRCRRRVAQSQQRFPLHALRAGARAAGVPGLRSARPEGPLDGDARASGEVAVGGERRRAVAHDRRRSHDGDVRRDPAAADLSRRVHRRRLQGRNRGAQRPHVPDVPSRDRRGQGGAQSRRDLRSARPRARIPRALHRRSRTRSASSTSSRSPRSSSAAWSTPARFSTTPRA